jgi:hypothetical protein
VREEKSAWKLCFLTLPLSRFSQDERFSGGKPGQKCDAQTETHILPGKYSLKINVRVLREG